MDYDLSRLNPRSFEQLIQGIGAEVLGPGLVMFGDGPDGGREAAIDAEVPYPSREDRWKGEVVLQAKFRQKPRGTRADGQWLIGRFRKEVHEYDRSDSNREWPRFLILVTNVTLSAAKDRGAKDKLFEMAAETPLRGFDVWDYDKLRVYLDRFEALRRSFAAYVLPGDVLAEVVDSLEDLKKKAPSFDDTIARFLQKELLADQWANLEQAGRAADEQVPVSRVFVDLPFSLRRQPDPPPEDSSQALSGGFAAYVSEIASRRLDPFTLRGERTGSEVAGGQSPASMDGRVVLIGGPGQGKSTMGQFICQMFRASILSSRSAASLSPEVVDALDAFAQHCDTSGIELPTVRRFPLRVALSKFAEELGGKEGPGSLLEYLAETISRRIQVDVSPSLMRDWLSRYPWLLVLDGLDEVPPASNRADVLAAIQELWVDTSQANADCLVIATTRPQGYGEEFSPRYYRHLWLAPLSTARALHYADRLLEVRIPDDDDRRSEVAGRLQRATTRVDTARLMTSPLQVTIMATLLERMGQPPEGRWNLFSQYYRVLYERELERDIPAASVLRDFKPDIDAIHRRVGLLLQVESEDPEQPDARISRERFTQIVKSRLREEEHTVEDDDALAKQIIDTAMERLVFLVGLEAEQVGFEIRSLQEFMAAEALLDGGDEPVARRLRAIAPLPAWRNVFLFAAGRCFSDLQHLRDTVHTICAELNAPGEDGLVGVALPGAHLAIDLLADGVADRQPRYQRLIAREALRIVRRPPSPVDDQLAEIYRPSLRRLYEEEIGSMLMVEDFSAALAAWRTLAVLGARGEAWALDLAESRLPGPHDLGDLIRSLSASAKSKRLARLLSSLCAAAPPSQSLPFRTALKELGVDAVAPAWFKALFELDSEPSPFTPTKIYFGHSGASRLWARVRSVHGYARIDEAVEAVFQHSGSEPIPTSWEPFLSALRFAERPSAHSLATELRNLSEASSYADVRQYGTHAPWPLAAILLSTRNGDDLVKFAQMASKGYFGSTDDWIAAEERWSEAHVQDADLALAGDGSAPYDSKVAESGFPLGGMTLSVGQEQRSAALVAMHWLEVARHKASRARAAFVVSWLLGGFSDDKGSTITAASLAQVLRPGDIEEGRNFYLDALNDLVWSQRLDSDEIRMLDELGAIVDEARNFRRPGLDPDLFDGLLRAWRAEPGRVGLYRILALGMPSGVTDDSSKAELLAVELTSSHGPARALLGLKLGERPSSASCAALSSSDGPWFDSALAAADGLGDVGLVEELLTLLDGQVSAWSRKEAVMSAAYDLIAKRSSELADEHSWRSLELFELPGEA